MSYFDNANTNVTRKSFGSKVDKTFQREGVVPLKDRKKDNGPDYVAEQAKCKELDKKVNDRRFNDYKQEKLFSEALQKGSVDLKEFLIKDFMSEIVIESLLVDRNIVEKNMNNIIGLVEDQLEQIGGFEGVKRIAMENYNPLLQNIVRVCEETAKDVAKRNLQDSKGKKADDLDLKLDKKEMEEFDYSKKSLGIETIVDVVKDKVFQVVQDEQKINNEKQEVITELEDKINELEAPVEEAMAFIFNKKTIEETTLFDSIMRKRYAQILESNSSPIFENSDPDLDDPEEYYGTISDDEYLMDEIELVDDEEVEDYFLENLCDKSIVAIQNAYSNKNVEDLYSTLESVNSKLNEYFNELKNSNNKSKSRFVYCKRQIMRLQESMEGILLNTPDEIEIEIEYSVNESTGLKIPTIDSIYASLESKMGKEPVNVEPNQNTSKEEMKLNKKLEEDVVVCPDCKNVECTCEGKDCEKMICEGFLSKNKVVESTINQLDNLCYTINKHIDVHEIAYNNALESLYVDVKGNSIILPYIQSKDCGLSNIEFAYKTKMVCEALKEDLMNVKYEQDSDILLKALEMNLKSINETLNNIANNEKYEYKTKVLNMSKRYICKINEVLVNADELPARVNESSLFNNVEDIERVYTESTDYFDITSTNNDLMETVLAETIVEYTIMEAFNTLNLVKYSKESVRQIARKNISR